MTSTNHSASDMDIDNTSDNKNKIEIVTVPPTLPSMESKMTSKEHENDQDIDIHIQTLLKYIPFEESHFKNHILQLSNNALISISISPKDSLPSSSCSSLMNPVLMNYTFFPTPKSMEGAEVANENLKLNLIKVIPACPQSPLFHQWFCISCGVIRLIVPSLYFAMDWFNDLSDEESCHSSYFSPCQDDLVVKQAKEILLITSIGNRKNNWFSLLINRKDKQEELKQRMERLKVRCSPNWQSEDAKEMPQRVIPNEQIYAQEMLGLIMDMYSKKEQVKRAFSSFVPSEDQLKNEGSDGQKKKRLKRKNETSIFFVD